MPYENEPAEIREVAAAKRATATGTATGPRAAVRCAALEAVTIRRAHAGDGPDLARLAALDSAAALVGDLLLAEIEGELWAALSLTDGRVVSDPFRPAAAARSLLLLRAGHLASMADGVGTWRGLAARLGVLLRARRSLREC